MPTYEYRCSSCGTFEVSRSIKDDALACCPTCQGAVTRIISRGGGLLFKGSGFYITDYRKPEYRKREKEEQGKAGGTADTKSKDTSGGPEKSGEAGASGAPAKSSEAGTSGGPAKSGEAGTSSGSGPGTGSHSDSGGGGSDKST